MTNDICIEWAPFELRAEVSESDLLAAAEDVQSGFLELQPGFVRRELLRGQQGRWVDLIVWASRHDAHAAAARVEDSAACQAYFRLMRAGDVGVEHFSRAWHCGPRGPSTPSAAED